MHLDALLTRCRGLESRAAALYRAFAARTRINPEVCAIWTALARDEEAHERTLARASGWLESTDGWRTDLVGWEEALEEIEERLAEAERPELGADVDQQLLAALALERTEIDTLFHRLLLVTDTAAEGIAPDAHVKGILTLCDRSTNPAVGFAAALLRAHARLTARIDHDDPNRAT